MEGCTRRILHKDYLIGCLMWQGNAATLAYCVSDEVRDEFAVVDGKRQAWTSGPHGFRLLTINSSIPLHRAAATRPHHTLKSSRLDHGLLEDSRDSGSLFFGSKIWFEPAFLDRTKGRFI